MKKPTSYQQSDAIAQLSLGKSTDYISHYRPELLQAVPRQLNRDELNLVQSCVLPFIGFDLWNMYELSWLNAKGKPQIALGELRLQADSLNLIESKSFKLYLNSYNQSTFNSIEQVQTHLTQDLSACAQGKLSLRLFPVTEALQISNLTGQCIDDLDIEVSHYQLQAEQLCVEDDASAVTEQLHSHLLKSNCLVTNQPDWGSVYIDYQGPKINQESLLRYIISFRQHNEFHEQCVERIFCDLMRYCKPEKLTVYARYTRRGGLDINPVRSNDPEQLALLTHHRLARQ